jgi:N-carbamoyl-L-amino-acid hydrolase
VDGRRLNAHLQELSEYGRNPQGGVSRVAYSEADLKAREYAIKLMREAQLKTGIDAAGNIVGARAGTELGRKPLVIGSHIDSVPEGGNYDGDVGSMAAIEVACTLSDKKIALRHPLEVIIFQNEEGGTVGSRAIASGLTENDLTLVSNSRKSIREGIRFIGGDPDNLSRAVRRKGEIAAYLELHIEQGGELFKEKIDIGVVEGIVGVYWWDVVIEGFANHAGTTRMQDRRDALLAAARYVDAVNRIVGKVPGRQVGTVGKIQASPGAYNVVPGRVQTSLDLRDLDAGKVRMIFAEIQREVREIETATGTKFDFKSTNSTPPAPTDERIRGAIEEVAKRFELKAKRMPSGAGHDAQEIAHIAPVGMIFIPSVDGISHSPREFSKPEDIVNGANVQLQTLVRLDEMF